MITLPMTIFFIPLICWLYSRYSFKRNILNVFHFNNNWIYFFDAFFVFCFFFRFIYWIQSPFLHHVLFSSLLNLSYILLGFLGLLTLLLAALDCSHFFELAFKKPHKQVHDNERREFFKQNIALSGLAICSFVSGKGYVNSFDPKIKKISIPLSEMHSNLHGLKIVQLSDIHIGPSLKKDFCEKLVLEVNALNPDLIAITGDMADGTVDFLGNDLLSFSGFKAKLGTFFITGNHEYYWNAREWIEWSQKMGMNTLENENIKLSYNGTDFFLAGVNDESSIHYDKSSASDPFKAAYGIPQNAYKILLAHQPKTCFRACKAGFHTQLSGHTHGGQGFPWNILVSLIQPYISGLNIHEGMNVYVHSGTGFLGPPNRFMIDPEIAEIVFEFKNRNI